MMSTFNLSDCERNFLKKNGNGSMILGLKKLIEEKEAFSLEDKFQETDKYMLFEMRKNTVVSLSKAEKEFLEKEGGGVLVKGIRRAMVKIGFDEFLKEYHEKIDNKMKMEKEKILKDLEDCPF